ncbi:MAG: metalloregulator ArsR/SmtB family transcription factor [Chloroflexi bacterium]|nr:metalloregulator ArsR/SmtB family transcription factor [Chloroflexota bacterium]
MSSNADIVIMFKALADTSRLKIVGLLAQQPYTVEQLAAMLELKASTISHHLARLAEAGLVSAKAEGYYSVYMLEKDVLNSKMQTIFSGEQMTAVTAGVNMDAFEQKVVKDFSMPDGRLKIIPAQRKKLEVILRHIVRDFEPGVSYSEKQVNEILARFHADTASLRRELVGAGLMQREGGGGAYWRED